MLDSKQPPSQEIALIQITLLYCCQRRCIIREEKELTGS